MDSYSLKRKLNEMEEENDQIDSISSSSGDTTNILDVLFPDGFLDDLTQFEKLKLTKLIYWLSENYTPEQNISLSRN